MPYTESDNIYSPAPKELPQLATPDEWREAAPFETIQALTNFLRPRVIAVFHTRDDVYIHIADEPGRLFVNQYVRRLP